MMIFRNDILPFKGFDAMNVFGILFVRKDANIGESVVRHERIHTKQMQELLFLFFYVWYVAEWLIKLLVYRDAHKAYMSIGFEREAYDNQHLDGYLECREHYCWIKRILL